MNRKENQIIMELYPLKLKAALKDYIWGGTRLRDEYGKASDLDKVAESWEMSVHPDGPSTIVNGPAAGKTLPTYLKEIGQAEPPILIKLIDAYDNLSVQVHPDNAYAQRVEGEPGKTEMWYIVEATPDAQLILQPVTPFGGCEAIAPARVLALQAAAAQQLRDVRVIPQTHRMMQQL